jgi:prevent-host-death family protein
MMNALALIDSGHVNCEMTINVTEFKARCLEILRLVEETGESVSIVKRNRVVAVVYPSLAAPDTAPIQRLQGTATLLAAPEESVMSERDFEALT